MCGRFYIEEEDASEDLQWIIDALNRRYNGNNSAKVKGEVRPTDIFQ